MSEGNDKPPPIPGPFRAYGGIAAVLSSKYFWVSVGLLIPTFPLWSKPEWWELPISVLPNILGFSLGAFALVVAFGDDRFRKVMMKAKSKGSQLSVHGTMAGTFYFFIFVQTLAFVSALISRALWEGKIPASMTSIREILGAGACLLWPTSFLLFLYGIILVIAAARWMFMISMAFEKDMTTRPQRNPEKEL